jgi:hypothetical protein
MECIIRASGRRDLSETEVNKAGHCEVVQFLVIWVIVDHHGFVSSSV